MLQALRREIIVKPIYETKTESGLIIPESAREHKLYHGSIFGEVISVGPQSMFKNEVKPGDRIVWQRHEGRKILFNGEVYFAIRDRWIRGRIDE